jgi:hypothetical protein
MSPEVSRVDAAERLSSRGSVLSQHFRQLPAPRMLALQSNPVRLGSYVSRAEARREIAGFRPGFWRQGQ